MSYLIAAPEFVSAAATDLANIGETISQRQRSSGATHLERAGRRRR